VASNGAAEREPVIYIPGEATRRRRRTVNSYLSSDSEIL
jgi:hypothetical protein